MNGGFIKLHRKMEHWEWYSDPPTFCLFLHMLFLTNWKDKRWKGIEVKRGQFISGRKALAEITGLSEQQIRTAINKLKSTREITSEATKVGTLYTVINYNTYQIDLSKSNQDINQGSNHASTSDQPSINHNRRTKELKIPPVVPQKKEGGILKSDWDAFCNHFMIEGISLTPDLNEQILAHLLAIKRDPSSSAKIRDPVAVAKARARSGDADRQYLRAVQAWLYPPPSEKECHCGGELEKRYAQGSGEWSFICQTCQRGYPKR